MKPEKKARSAFGRKAARFGKKAAAFGLLSLVCLCLDYYLITK